MSTFKINDLVWAKMKGFPPWPGVITEPTKELKAVVKKSGVHHCIFFFGSNNYSWIEASNLKPYSTFKEELKNANKSASFKLACEEIEKFIEKGPSAVFTPPAEEDAFDKLVGSTESTPTTDKTKSPKKLKGILKKPSLTPTNKKSPVQSLAKKDEDLKSSAQKRTKTPRKETSPVFPKKRSSTDSSIDLKPKRRYMSYIDPDSTLPDSQEENSVLSFTPTYRKSPGANLLHRPPNISRPVNPPLNLENISETLLQKNIEPSSLNFGFLGLGIMGSGIVKNLLNSKHKVIVWNRSPEKSVEFKKAGAEVALTPSDVVSAADVTFCCVSDTHAAKEMVFGNCGALTEMGPGKSYVEMTGIDTEASLDIAEAITSRGGKYLEVRLHGSKKEAEEGSLIVMAAGDRALYSECESCFQAFGKNSFYLGEAGNASKMNLVLQLMSGITLAGLAESMALADRAGLPQVELLNILKISLLNCPYILDKCTAIHDCNYTTNMALSHLQKDVKLALNLGDSLEQPLPLGATTNEHFKHAKKLGYGDHDSSAIFVGARF